MFSSFRLSSKCFFNSKHTVSFKKCNSYVDFHSKNSLYFSLKGTQFNRGIAAAALKKGDVSYFEDFKEPLISFKYLRLLKKTIREGGPIIEENAKLAMLLSKAKEYNISEEFINYITRISIDTRSCVGLVEMLLDNNCHLIIQYEDIDLSTTKPHLLKMCDKYDGFLVRKDIKWTHRFEQVGMLFVPRDDKISALNDLGDKRSAASKFGAISVQSIVDAEELPYWRFYCEPSKLHEVKRVLMKENFEVEEAYVGYIPKHKVSLTNSAKKTLKLVLTDMNQIPMIDNVFINI